MLGVNESMHQRADALLTDAETLVQQRVNAMQALQHLTDAETAQRGFLITGRSEYLTPYEIALAELPRQLEPTLAFLSKTGSAAGADADAARILIQRKLIELSRTVELQRAGQRAEALALVESDIGRASMEQIRAKLSSALAVAARERAAASREIVNVRELRRWAVHGLALLAAAALWAYLRRVSAETALRESARAQLEHEVQARTEDLRALAANLQTMQEDERAMLSRELHDELGGLLTAAKLDLARAARATHPTQAAERIAQAGRRIDDVVGVKRRIIEALRPTALEHLGLRTSLEQLCRDVAKRLEIEVATTLDDVVLPEQAQITVYRIVQEALNNIQKYARAQRVEVTLTSRPGEVQLVVQDNGQGFDTAGLRVGRHGLAGMRYRVEALGGRLAIRSAPGQGTRIEAHLPPG